MSKKIMGMKGTANGRLSYDSSRIPPICGCNAKGKFLRVTDILPDIEKYLCQGVYLPVRITIEVTGEPRRGRNEQGH